MYISHSLYAQDILHTIEENESLSAFCGRNVLITGASGLVGSSIVDLLMAYNRYRGACVHIHALGSTEQSVLKRFPSYVHNMFFHPHAVDLCASGLNNLPPMDFLVHTASYSHPQRFELQPVEVIRLNVQGTLNVLQLAGSNTDIRCVVCSTYEVYGREETHQPPIFRENKFGTLDFNQPRSCYPESKRMAENLCVAYRNEYRCHVAVARLASIIGPTVKEGCTKADVCYMDAAIRGHPITMLSLGTMPRTWCYVIDSAAAILRILTDGDVGAYNVGAFHASLRDIAECIGKIAGVGVHNESTEHSARYELMMDCSKLGTLGWHPLFDMQQTLTHTYTIRKDFLK